MSITFTIVDEGYDVTIIKTFAKLLEKVKGLYADDNVDSPVSMAELKKSLDKKCSVLRLYDLDKIHTNDTNDWYLRVERQS